MIIYDTDGSYFIDGNRRNLPNDGWLTRFWVHESEVCEPNET